MVSALCWSRCVYSCCVTCKFLSVFTTSIALDCFLIESHRWCWIFTCWSGFFSGELREKLICIASSITSCIPPHRRWHPITLHWWTIIRCSASVCISQSSSRQLGRQVIAWVLYVPVLYESQHSVFNVAFNDFEKLGGFRGRGGGERFEYISVKPKVFLPSASLDLVNIIYYC